MSLTCFSNCFERYLLLYCHKRLLFFKLFLLVFGILWLNCSYWPLLWNIGISTFRLSFQARRRGVHFHLEILSWFNYIIDILVRVVQKIELVTKFLHFWTSYLLQLVVVVLDDQRDALLNTVQVIFQSNCLRFNYFKFLSIILTFNINSWTQHSIYDLLKVDGLRGLTQKFVHLCFWGEKTIKIVYTCV